MYRYRFLSLFLIALMPPTYAGVAPLEQLTFAASGGSFSPSVSNDGRWIAFHSTANLTGGNPAAKWEVFLLDTSTMTTTQLTTSTTGSFSPSISGDGSTIYFHSQDDHIGGNPDLNTEVFAYFRSAGNIFQQTFTSPPVSSDSASARGDGSCFAYRSDGGGAQNPDGTFEIFSTCHTIGSPVTASAGNSAQPKNNSVDGKTVVFWSDGDHTGGNADGTFEVFALIPGTGTIQVTDSVTDNSAEPVVSGSGNTIVFHSPADHTGSNPDTFPEIFLFDVLAQTITQLTSTTFKVSTEPTISENGRIVAFISNADFTGDNTAGIFELFTHNLTTGTIEQITSGGASAPVLTHDGSFAVFASNADPLGTNTDGSFEIFRARVGLVFSDGFESGTTGAWTVSVP